MQGLSQGTPKLVAVEFRGGVNIAQISTNATWHIGASGGFIAADDALFRWDRGVVLSDSGVVRHALLSRAFKLGAGT